MIAGALRAVFDAVAAGRLDEAARESTRCSYHGHAAADRHDGEPCTCIFTARILARHRLGGACAPGLAVDAWQRVEAASLHR